MMVSVVRFYADTGSTATKSSVRSRSVCCNNGWNTAAGVGCGTCSEHRLQAATFSLTSLSFQQKYLLGNAVVLLLPGWHEDLCVQNHGVSSIAPIRRASFRFQSPGLGEWHPPPPKQCTQVSWEWSVSVVNRWGDASYLSLSGFVTSVRCLPRQPVHTNPPTRGSLSMSTPPSTARHAARELAPTPTQLSPPSTWLAYWSAPSHPLAPRSASCPEGPLLPNFSPAFFKPTHLLPISTCNTSGSI